MQAISVLRLLIVLFLPYHHLRYLCLHLQNGFDRKRFPLSSAFVSQQYSIHRNKREASPG